jgi:plastocyanin
MSQAIPAISRRRLLAAAAIALPAVGLARLLGGQDVGAADVAATINNFAFAPNPLTVPVGTRVVWTNMQVGVPHTVTSDTGVWDSGTVAPGGTFAFMFNTAGTFAYHCNIHPTMHGTVMVTGQAAGTTPATTTTAPTTSAPTTAPTKAPTTAPTTAPPAAPRTGGGGEAPQPYFIRRLGDG